MKTTENGDNTRTAFTDTSDYFEGIKDNAAALRKFFTAMPKGGDIHNHLTGSAYAETYFELAVKYNMYVDMETGKLYKEPPKDGKVIQLSKEMDALHNHRMTLIDKWSIRNFQPYKYPLGPDEYFFGTFGLLSALTSIHDYDDEFSLNNLAYLMHELKVRAFRENVQYLEVIGIAPVIPEDCFLEGHVYNYYDSRLKKYLKTNKYDIIKQSLRQVLDIFEETKNAQKNVEDYFAFVQNIEEKSNTFKTHLNNINEIECRYQGYAVRGLEPLIVFAQLYVVYKACLKDGSGMLLAGCNIVAAENGEKAMMYYDLHMLMFQVLTEKYKSVNVSLHAGELTLGLIRPEHLTYHIGNAIKYSMTRRIGHGVCLPFELDSDTILQTMQQEGKKIPVEINLTSNEFILGVKDTEHPITLYHKAGVPIIISTDDPGILRTSLTEQYTLATLRYGFSYDEIKQFVYNSIKYSFLPNHVQKSFETMLNNLFNNFEKQIIKKE
ncbi:hypothetical protein [Bacteroides hominis]|uniref:hypothetical protein n=1 Tax=Bacteroides hominis TaxID=2763023 RepID=UPI00164AAA63|nr:hypothetical protein [Bacteroides hominis (ex Liu et al. 2022)]MBC5614554.1 hypothetical protein [Bacteroides hominis (ex Liu et al. 2022)]